MGCEEELNFICWHKPVPKSRELGELDDAIMRFRQEEWFPLHTRHPDKAQTLYHYTDYSGLKGILGERAIWFSHMTSLNDPNELKYGKRVITDVISRVQDSDRRFFSSLPHYFDKYALGFDHPFLACFCESDDLLSQWRIYGDNGKGYCLGLDFHELPKASEQKDPLEPRPVILRKVIYDKEQQRALIEKFFECILDVVKRRPQEDSVDRWAGQMAALAVNVLLEMQLVFKHHAFEGEKEWRIIYVSRNNFRPETMRFRETEEGPIPYRSMYLFREESEKQFPLQSVTLGPGLDIESQRASTALLLQNLSCLEHQIGFNANSIVIRSLDYCIR